MEDQDWIERQEIIERINQKYNQTELDERMEGLKKMYAEQVDKQDMSELSTPKYKMEYLGTFEEPARDNHTIIDPLLKEVGQVVWDQQKKVLASGKYPHPIHKDNHTAMEWMDHQMSEFADALVYHQCLKQTIQEVIKELKMAKSVNESAEVERHLDHALNRLRG